jgi:hypothetical protein
MAVSGMFITHSNSRQFLIRITDNNNSKKQEVMNASPLSHPNEVAQLILGAANNLTRGEKVAK